MNKELAVEYGVDPSTISHVRAGRHRELVSVRRGGAPVDPEDTV